MSTVVDLVVISFIGFFQWYIGEILDFSDIIVFFFRQLILYLIFQLILEFFPFIKRIVSYLWFPFRFLHVYMHVYAAKEIARELEQKKDDEEELDQLYDRNFLSTSFATGLGRLDENAMIIGAVNRVEYAKRVAFAPSKFGWAMLIAYLVITPLILITPLSHVFTTIVGAIIHFYFFVGIFMVIMPSMKDWLIYLNAIILNLNVRPVYLYNAMLVHVVFTFDTFWRTKDFLIAIVVGSVMFLIYLWGVFLVAYIALKGKMREPGVFFLPFKSGKELRGSAADIEVQHSEDDLIL